MLKIVTLICIGLLTSAAKADQATASFNVGLTIGPRKANSVRLSSASTYTWGAAAISAGNAGFANLSRVDKTAIAYSFSGTKNGANFLIEISMSSGQIIAIVPA